MTETTAHLGSVQKTLLLPLWGRAVETRKRKPLLVDAAAVDIVGKLDYDFSTIAANVHPITRLAWIARSLHVDRTLREFLARRPRATVVNIGCGLDTTFERIDNGSLRWIDLDLPDVIRLREKLLPRGQRQRSLACSVLDPEWPQEVEAGDGVMLVAAGVLYYLEETQVRVLFSTLSQALPNSEMVFDVCSPWGARVANKKVIRDSGMDASALLQWGVHDVSELAAWDRRIEVEEAYRMFKGLGARLPWRARFGTMLSDAMNIMFMAHLRFRSDQEPLGRAVGAAQGL